MTATATLRTAPRLDVDRLIGDPRTRIIVCCGSGGVGKTTVAAALGLRAAEQGRNVVVLTVDPARRLAQSMGLTALDNTPRVVAGAGAGSGAGSHAGSGSRAGGSLHAMMLDMKRTFDEIVEQHADPDRAAQILVNPFYQSLSSGFSGIHTRTSVSTRSRSSSSSSLVRSTVAARARPRRVRTTSSSCRSTTPQSAN